MGKPTVSVSRFSRARSSEAGSAIICSAAFEIVAAASAGTMPSRAWARANAASTSAQRAMNASSPNAARIPAVPNMSPNKVDCSTPLVMDQIQENAVVGKKRLAGDFDRCPAGWTEAFECREARLVGHLRALGDPIAEIDVGQSEPPAFLDQPQDGPSAQALPVPARG